MPDLELITLPGPFGIEARGVDVARGVDSDTLHVLAKAYVEHHVLLLRGQNPSLETYAEYARQWGDPRINEGFSELAIAGIEGMNKVGNVGVLRSDEYRNGASFWHTDCAAETDPNAATMLYCHQAPDTGGETVIADMQAAYGALEKTEREEIEPLMAHHCFSGSREIIGGAEAWEFPVHKMSEETVENLPPPTVRSLARSHSVTGRKGLYSPAGSIIAIEGMQPAAAHTLLRRLKLHAIKEVFCYFHRYRAGDILMWDNTATMHFASPVDAPTGETDARLLYRMVLKGLPPALGMQKQ